MNKEILNNIIKKCALAIIQKGNTIEQIQKTCSANYDYIEQMEIADIISYEAFKALILSKVNSFNADIF